MGSAPENALALSEAVQGLLDQEVTFAEQNAKRLNLVRQSFRQEDLERVVSIVDGLVSPFDHAMNQLLQRSSLLHALRFNDLDQCDNSASSMSDQDVKGKCKSVFLKWISGEWGQNIIRSFVDRLKAGDLTNSLSNQSQEISPSLLQRSFELFIFGVSDTWRRMVFVTQNFPFRLFSLIGCDMQSFIAKWCEFQALLVKCPHCVDIAFSAPLLRSVVFTDDMSDSERAACVHNLVQLLSDLAIYCPLATDGVECLHGQHQTMLAKFRGKSKQAKAAGIMSVVHSLQREHAHLKARVNAKTLPGKFRFASMIRQLGRKQKRGQPPQAKNKTQRRQRAAAVKLRRLSGWNVFQRERMQQVGGKVSGEGYRQLMCQWSSAWHNLTRSQKECYELEAKYEQSCREVLETRPLSHGKEKIHKVVEGNLKPTADLEKIAGVVGILNL